MTVIPMAIVIGIVEDKIANGLTSKKSIKEHLEDIKNEVENYKPSKNKTQYDLIIYLEGFEDPLEYHDVKDVRVENGFLIFCSEDDGTIAKSIDNITEYRIKQSSGLRLDL